MLVKADNNTFLQPHNSDSVLATSSSVDSWERINQCQRRGEGATSAPKQQVSVVWKGIFYRAESCQKSCGGVCSPLGFLCAPQPLPTPPIAQRGGWKALGRCLK